MIAFHFSKEYGHVENDPSGHREDCKNVNPKQYSGCLSSASSQIGNSTCNHSLKDKINKIITKIGWTPYENNYKLNPKMH